MITEYRDQGYYIDECRLPEETKKDHCFPAQHNTIQLSADRWLVIYNTRGFRGNDDHRSVVYQVRADAADGPVLSEGYLDRQVMDWDPLGDGSTYVKLCTHLVAFGVPSGACIDGHPVPHGGSFAAIWTRFPRVYDVARDYLLHDAEGEVPHEAYRCVWVQFRLNATTDDIEITQPVQTLQESRYAGSTILCRHEKLNVLNAGYVNPVPYNRDCTEWAFLVHWNRGAIESAGLCTAIRLSWNPRSARYEWSETGPLLDGPGAMGIFEGGIAPYRDEWLISARVVPRTYSGNVWFRTPDLFGDPPEPVYSEEIRSTCPRTTYCFPDGIVRVFTTDQLLSPYAKEATGDVRMPLHALEVDPDDDFRVVRAETVFDSHVAGLPIRPESGPCAHFCYMVPHAGGAQGYLTYSVRPKALKHPWSFTGVYKGLVNAEEMQVSGVYYSRIHYAHEHPPAWTFTER